MLRHQGLEPVANGALGDSLGKGKVCCGERIVRDGSQWVSRATDGTSIRQLPLRPPTHGQQATDDPQARAEDASGTGKHGHA